MAGLNLSDFLRESPLQESPRGTVVSGRVTPSETDLTIGSGRRLERAIMFLDICSFSSRQSETKSEQTLVLNALDVFFSEMVKIAERFNGTVEKNTGDGLMIRFEKEAGTTANVCASALDAAVEMMAVNDRVITPQLLSKRIEPIRFRIAMDYGPITIARLGAAKRFNSNIAIGTKANIASKFLAFGGPGDILLGDVAYSQLGLLHSISTEIHRVDTGWIYRIDSRPYLCHRYKYGNP